MTREEAKALLGRTALLMFEHNGSSTLDGDKTLHIINQIFDEHEKELKQAYIDGSNSNNGLIKFYLKHIEEKDKEIEKLRSIVEEAIRKPMGVEPHSWSDYKMQKDNA